MKKPKTQLQEILYLLLKNDSITFRHAFFETGIINLTARISDLRNLFIDVRCDKKQTTNKFGRKVFYGSWYLDDKEKAERIYNKLTDGNK